MKAYITDLKNIDPELSGYSVQLSDTIMDSDFIVDDPTTLPDSDPIYWVENSGTFSLNEDIKYHENIIKTELETLYQEKKLNAISFVIGIELSSGIQSFNFTDESRQDFRDLREEVIITNATIQWKTLDNNFIPLTQEDFNLIFLKLIEQGQEVFNAYQLDKAEVYNNNYDFINLNNV